MHGSSTEKDSTECSAKVNIVGNQRTKNTVLKSGMRSLGPWGIKDPRGRIFRRIHGMPRPPNGSLNVSGSCLTIFRYLYYVNIEISI